MCQRVFVFQNGMSLSFFKEHSRQLAKSVVKILFFVIACAGRRESSGLTSLNMQRSKREPVEVKFAGESIKS